MSGPVYQKIHLEMTNWGDTYGKDIQLTLIFRFKGREIFQDVVYFGDIPTGYTRSKNIIVKLDINDYELDELQQNSDLLEWEYGDPVVNGRILENS